MNKNLTKNKIIETLKKEMPYLRKRYGVEQVAVYGSFAKGHQTKKSDIDILVKFLKPLGLEFMDLIYHLETVFGRNVDLTTFDTLRRSSHNPRYRRIASEIQKTLNYV